MAADIDRSNTGNRRKPDGGSSRLAQYLAGIRRNAALSRAIVTRRRRDIRFQVVPYSLFEIANLGAVTITALVLLVILFDPYVRPWQQALPERLVGFFKLVTRFGKSDWILISTGIFCIAAFILDATALPARARMRRAVRALAALYVFASVAISGITANFTKYLLGRARPRHFDESGSFAFDFWSSEASWASFPSGHSTTGMALGVALALLFPRLRSVFLCLGFWIGMSRVFVGAHYPSDVLGGCVLGGVTAWLFARVLARQRLVFGFAADGSLVRRPGASGRLR
jgi:membrane-associated phospholipid phosphatase